MANLQEMFGQAESTPSTTIGDMSLNDFFVTLQKKSENQQSSLHKSLNEYASKLDETFEANQQAQKKLQANQVKYSNEFYEKQNNYLDQQITAHKTNQKTASKALMQNQELYENFNKQSNKMIKSFKNDELYEKLDGTLKAISERKAYDPKFTLGTEGEKQLRQLFFEENYRSQKKFEDVKKLKDESLREQKVSSAKSSLESKKAQSWLFNFSGKFDDAVSSLWNKTVSKGVGTFKEGLESAGVTGVITDTLGIFQDEADLAVDELELEQIKHDRNIETAKNDKKALEEHKLDVEEYKQVEKDLIESQKRYRKILEDKNTSEEERLEAEKEMLTNEQNMKVLQSDVETRTGDTEKIISENEEFEKMKGFADQVEEQGLVEQMKKGLIAPLFDLTEDYLGSAFDRILQKIDMSNMPKKDEEESAIDYVGDLSTPVDLSTTLAEPEEKTEPSLFDNNPLFGNEPTVEGESTLMNDENGEPIVEEESMFGPDEMDLDETLTPIEQAEEEIDADNMKTEARVENTERMATAEQESAAVKGEQESFLDKVMGKFAKNRKKEHKEEMMGNVQEIMSTTFSWATKAGESASAIPIIGAVAGPIVAAAIVALGGVFAAKAAGLFAEGGVIPGESASGDKLMAMVNSGEMILNTDQQSNLLNNMADGASADNMAAATSQQQLLMDAANAGVSPTGEQSINNIGSTDTNKNQHNENIEILNKVASLSEETVNELKNVIDAVKSNKVTLRTSIPGKQFNTVQHNLNYGGY